MSKNGFSITKDATEETSVILIYAFPTFASCALAYFLLNRFVLEKIVMPKVYKSFYTSLDISKRRSFTCHQQWLIVKTCLMPAAWPFIATFFCGKRMSDSLVGNSLVTYGDYLSVCYMAVIAMFVFELVYRTSISPVSMIHHSAGILLACWQVASNLGSNDPSNDSQFRLLILYGVFEVCFETFPHFAVIYYRTHPKNMLGCARIWLAAAIFAGCGTTGEVAAVAVFMWRNWWQWDLAMKIVQPILHFAFMGAQVHGARVAFSLYLSYMKKHDKQIQESNLEAAATTTTLSNDVETPFTMTSEASKTLAGMSPADEKVDGLDTLR